MTYRPNSQKTIYTSRNERATRRQERAEARRVLRAVRSDEEQLQILIDRGHPECREAERLRAHITAATKETS